MYHLFFVYSIFSLVVIIYCLTFAVHKTNINYG